MLRFWNNSTQCQSQQNAGWLHPKVEQKFYPFGNGVQHVRHSPKRMIPVRSEQTDNEPHPRHRFLVQTTRNRQKYRFSQPIGIHALSRNAMRPLLVALEKIQPRHLLALLRTLSRFRITGKPERTALEPVEPRRNSGSDRRAYRSQPASPGQQGREHR